MSNNFPQSPPLNEQLLQQMRMGIDIPLDPDMPEPKLPPSCVAGDPGSDNCLGLFYLVDVDVLETWAKNSNLKSGSLVAFVEEPEVTGDFRELPKISYENNCESRVLQFTVMIIEQLKNLIPGFYKLASRQRMVWCRHFI